MLVYEWACEFQKAGHQVSVVAPQGSQLPEGIELIATNQHEGEDATWNRYKDRLLKGDWDCCTDNTWSWFSVISQMQADRQLPVIHIHHGDYATLGSPPPIQYPCIVGISRDQAENIRKRWSIGARDVYNGVDLSFYKHDPSVQKSNRYLWIGRYTPEKMPLETILLAKKCRIPIDMFGDLTIIADQNYANKCFQEADGLQIKVAPGISRQDVVKQMQSHKALIHLVGYNEAFGLVPIEAQACGLPVIVNSRGALPELVKDARSGYVVAGLDEAEDVITQDLVSKIKPSDCRKQAEKFSIEASAAGHLKCLQDVVNGIYW